VGGSAEALRRAAVPGAGSMSLPLFHVASDLAAGRLVRLLEAHPLSPLGVFAVYSKGKFVPAKVRRFVDHVAATMRPPPWEQR